MTPDALDEPAPSGRRVAAAKALISRRPAGTRLSDVIPDAKAVLDAINEYDNTAMASVGGWLEPIPTGLTRDQEIRAQALEASARLLAPLLASPGTPYDMIDNPGKWWLTFATTAARYITTGETPE